MGALPDWLSEVPGGARLALRVSPKASANKVAGEQNGRLRVRVTAAPEDGKANAAVTKLLAKRLGVGRTSVAVTSGATTRDKTVEVAGVSAEEVARELAS